MRTFVFRSCRRAVLVGAAAVAVVALAACSGGGSTGTGTSSAPSSAAVDPSLKVPAPLPTQALLSDPCSAVTDAQLAGVGLAPPGQVSEGPPKLCGWNSTATAQNRIDVGAVPQNNGGISDIYSQKSREAYFEPVTVNGYPGVFADIQDGRASGSCTLWVGITDQLAFSVVTSLTTGPNKSNPCPKAQQLGEAMIAHLKGTA